MHTCALTWNYDKSFTAPGIVVACKIILLLLVQQQKITVFEARGKLAGTTIGMDDLTHLQQKCKNAAWLAFKDFKARGVRTQWRAEKLFVKEGEHIVEHKVLDL